MAKKGQKFETYSLELKYKAIQMQLQGMTKQLVAEELKIADIDLLKPSLVVTLIIDDTPNKFVDGRSRSPVYK